MISMNLRDIFDWHLDEVARALGSLDFQSVLGLLTALVSARTNHRWVWVLGNGGSASTASHLANDLVKQCGIKAQALPEQTATVTAFGNDDGWENMYANLLRVFASPDDLVIGISCSGESPNVITAACNHRGYVAILTGDNRDSTLVSQARAKSIIFVEHPDILVQESVHMAICHAVVKALKKESTQ